MKNRTWAEVGRAFCRWYRYFSSLNQILNKREVFLRSCGGTLCDALHEETERHRCTDLERVFETRLELCPWGSTLCYLETPRAHLSVISSHTNLQRIGSEAQARASLHLDWGASVIARKVHEVKSSVTECWTSWSRVLTKCNSTTEGGHKDVLVLICLAFVSVCISANFT